MQLTEYLASKRKLIDEFLDNYLPKEEEFPSSIHKAMRYTLFADGKRLRPVLAIAACEIAGGDIESILPAACSLELIHTYSLIHDDLPAIDNDDIRRGQPSSHKKFGEAIAILAGDALLTQAFSLMAMDSKLSKDIQIKIIQEVSKAAGSSALIGGQVVDIESSSYQNNGSVEINAPLLEYIHAHKTGELFRTSLRIGALAGGADQKQLAALTGYGEKIGLGFQIIDDILDIECTQEELGKPQGSDLAKNKLTYPAVWGMSAAKSQASDLINHACLDLDIFGPKAQILKEIAQLFLTRRK